MAAFRHVFAGASGSSHKNTPHRHAEAVLRLQRIENHLTPEEHVAIIEYWEDHKGSSDTYMSLTNDDDCKVWLK
jgi:hypothetical protein